MILEHGTKCWKIGKMVAETPTYRLGICTDASTGQVCLLQSATSTEYNGRLERASFVLGWLKRAADRMEKEDPDPSGQPSRNYDRLFPLVADDFASEAHGGRRILILGFKDVEDVSLEMFPLSRYRDQGNQRLDLESSAWIMGRLLKLLGLTHGEGVAVNLLTGNNVLIGPENHYAVVLDWTASVMHKGTMPADDRRREIAAAAQTVFSSIGGDPATGAYPYLDPSDQNYRYVELLWSLASDPDRDAPTAHRRFYELIDELWGVVFHPFTTWPM